MAPTRRDLTLLCAARGTFLSDLTHSSISSAQLPLAPQIPPGIGRLALAALVRWVEGLTALLTSAGDR